jgi:hypothetical protein
VNIILADSGIEGARNTGTGPAAGAEGMAEDAEGTVPGGGDSTGTFAGFTAVTSVFSMTTGLSMTLSIDGTQYAPTLDSG